MSPHYSPSAPATNQYFSFARFGRLFRRHTAEHLRSYAMSAAVLGGLLLLLMGFVTYKSGSPLNQDVQIVFFMLFLMLAGTMFTSNVFAQLGDKRQATVALLLPASHLEKYLVAWLYSLPLFLLVFLGVYYLVDATLLYAAAQPGTTPEFFNVFSEPAKALEVFWTVGLLHAAWLCGAIYFEKTHFIRTGFVLFIVLMALGVLNFQVLKLLTTPELRPEPPFSEIQFMEGKQLFTVGLPEAQTAWLALLPVGLALLLWAAAYFRVTEKQL